MSKMEKTRKKMKTDLEVVESHPGIPPGVKAVIKNAYGLSYHISSMADELKHANADGRVSKFADIDSDLVLIKHSR